MLSKVNMDLNPRLYIGPISAYTKAGSSIALVLYKICTELNSSLTPKLSNNTWSQSSRLFHKIFNFGMQTN